MKKKILITGKVHDVGYRPFLLSIAESLEIERFFADNIKINGKEGVVILLDSSLFLIPLRKRLRALLRS